MQNSLSWCSLERFLNANHSWNLNMKNFNNKNVAPINEQLELKGIFWPGAWLLASYRELWGQTLPSSNRVHLAQKLLPLNSKGEVEKQSLITWVMKLKINTNEMFFILNTPYSKTTLIRIVARFCSLIKHLIIGNWL